MKILLTGSNGFLGRHLHATLRSNSALTVTPVGRRVGNGNVIARDIGGSTTWADLLLGHDVVIHAAARAHVMEDEVADPLEEYRRVNVDGTLNLARQAAATCVKRFIFISSIKVNGEQTQLGQPFTADDRPAPEDAYGISKWEAEQGLQQLSTETGIEVIIIRPPLVYGPGVKGNFSSMIKLVSKRLPLPLGAIHNQRSLVGLDNLVDLIITCIDHPAAANQVFLASDGRDLSTSELLRGIAASMSAPSRMIPVPASFLMFAATVLGKQRIARRVLGSLQVDIKKTRDLLGWTPPVSIDEGLRRCFKPHP